MKRKKLLLYILLFFFSFLKAWGSESPKDSCEMTFHPHPSLREDEKESLSILFNKQIPQNIQKDLSRIVIESQGVFESSIDTLKEVFFFYQDGLYSISQISRKTDASQSQALLDKDIEFSVKVNLMEKASFPQKIQFFEKSKRGGTLDGLVFQEKEVKRIISKVPVHLAQKIYAVQVPIDSSDRSIFVLYKDISLPSKKGNTIEFRREIIDFISPRPYRIDINIRGKIHQKHGLKLRQVDEAFMNWDGLVYRNIYFKRYSVDNTEEMKSLQKKIGEKQSVAFLSSTGEGEAIVVFLRLSKESKLPFVVTAFHPDEIQLEELSKLQDEKLPIKEIYSGFLKEKQEGQ